MKRAVVIGGTGTVGAAVCRALAARGARVGLTFHRAEAAARELVDELEGARARRLDLLAVDSIRPTLRELAEEIGGIDALVCAAGVASTHEPARADTLEELDSAGWDRLFGVNVKGNAFACRALADALSVSEGNIVLVGSINGVKPVPTPAAYASSKAALIGLAQALGKELGPRGVRVNVVAPGLLDAGAGTVLPAATREDYVAHTALGRFGTAAEIARSIAWFALDNTYVNGRTVTLDGGL